jgi:RNA polymerase sigma-70 factor (ECF subfamily)
VDAARAAIEPDVERLAVEQAQRGDPSALERVLLLHSEALFSSVLLPRTGDRALAEDLLRETCVTAIEKIGSFRWQGRSLFFWLRRIALHKLIDHHRRSGRSRRLVEQLLVEANAAEPAPGADAELIAAEDRLRARARIERAMAQLPERQALAIRLRVVEERPREECALALAVTVGNFDVILFRAVRAFRKAYGDPDGE